MKQMCIIRFQNFIKNCQEHTLMNIIIYQTQKEKKMNSTYKPKKLFIEEYNYGDWYENQESRDNEESEMPPLEGDAEKVKKRKND